MRRACALIPEPHDPWILLVRCFLPQTGGPLWRKSAVEAVGGWKVDSIVDEYHLYLRLLMAGSRFLYCPHVGAVYRRWSDTTLSRRDRPEVARRRAKIIDRVEELVGTASSIDIPMLLKRERVQGAEG